MSDSLKSYLLVLLKGMAMGAADVVPGVSGGTIAFITGIYERLLGALKSLTPAALMLWYRQGFNAFWRFVDGSFLLVLFAGVGISIFSLAHLISLALANYPLHVWGFFFGLIIASTLYVSRELDKRSLVVLAAFGVGLALALLVAVAKPVQVPVTYPFLFIAGCIAICAMILPGISGSFLLLIMGIYPVMLEAIRGFELLTVGVFLAGCITGLLLFSHVLSFLLKRYRQATLGLLTGFLAGSLAIVWPWKQVVVAIPDRHGEMIPLVQKNVSPWTYELVHPGQDAVLLSVTLLAMAGLLIIVIIEYCAQKWRL